MTDSTTSTTSAATSLGYSPSTDSLSSTNYPWNTETSTSDYTSRTQATTEIPTWTTAYTNQTTPHVFRQLIN